MATPNLRVQNAFLTLLPDSPNELVIPIVGLDGEAIDASTGYTLQTFFLVPASDANSSGGPSVNVTSHGTFDFGDGSLTWSLTDAESQTLANLFPTFGMAGQMRISNDAGDSLSRLAAVNVRIG